MSAFVGPGRRGNSALQQVGSFKLLNSTGNNIFLASPTQIAFGNTGDNAPVTFAGTGQITFSGLISASAGIITTGGGQSIVIRGTGVGAANFAYMAFQDVNGSRTGYVGDASTANGDIHVESDLGNVSLLPQGVQGLYVGATQLTFGDTTRNQAYTFLGTGNGNVGGQWTFTAPAGGNGIVVLGSVSEWTIECVAANAGSASFGLLVLAGSSTGDSCFTFNNRANTQNILSSDGLGNITAGNTANFTRFTSIGQLSVQGTSAVVSIFNQQSNNPGYIVYERGSNPVGYVGDSSALVTGGNLDDFAIRAQGNLVLAPNAGVNAMTLFSTFANINYALNILGVAKAYDDSNTLQTLGWRDLVINSQFGNYVFALSDRNKAVYFNSGNAGVVYTIPASTFSPGNTFSVIHTGSGAPSVTIAAAGGVTLIWNNSSFITGNRTINQGIATIICVGTNTFVIGGSGLS